MIEVAAVVLAAGTASRYRALDPTVPSKLVAVFRGKPLVRWAVEAATASRARPVVVVTGYAREAVEAALEGIPVKLVWNAAFDSGLASSLKAGIAALPSSCAGAMIVLGDMPLLSAEVVNHIVDAFAGAPAATAVAPSVEGRRGNPVLLSRKLFADVGLLEGDEGARALLRGRADVTEVPIQDAAVAEDIDTPTALRAAAGAVLSRQSAAG